MTYSALNILTVAPMFHIMLEPCFRCLEPCLALLARLRWCCTHVLEFQVVPNVVPVIPLPYLREICYVSLGEVFLVLPLILWMLEGFALSFRDGDVEKSGQVASYVLFVAFLTANKANSLVSLFFGIPFERLVSLHMLSGLSALLLGCFHTYAAFAFGGDDDGDSAYASFGTRPDFGRFLFDGQTNLTGSLLVLCMTITVALSIFPIVRRTFFQLWLYTHMLSAAATIFLCLLHGVTTMVFVLLWLVFDWVVRYVLMASWRYQAKAELQVLMDGSDDLEKVVQITLPEKPYGFVYSPGQFVQLAVPSISAFEFHPVSICSAPHEEQMTFRLRGVGDWTKKLVAYASKHETCSIMMEGPYGSMSIDLNDHSRYQTVLLVAGGIGSTHCESVGKSLLHEHYEEERPLTKLRYVWAVRQRRMPQEMPPLGGDALSSGQSGAYSAGRRSTAVTSRDLESDFNMITGAKNVQIDVYCTEDSNSADSYTTYSARPNLDDILEEVKQEAIQNNQVSIAVVGCGPRGMMESLREACREHSSKVVGCGGDDMVFFDLHTERFEF